GSVDEVDSTRLVKDDLHLDDAAVFVRLTTPLDRECGAVAMRAKSVEIEVSRKRSDHLERAGLEERVTCEARREGEPAVRRDRRLGDPSAEEREREVAR